MTPSKIARLSFATGCLLGPVGFALAQAPAAKLQPPKPVTPVGGAVLSRGAAPDFSAFDPNKPVTPAFAPVPAESTPKSTGGWFSGPSSAPPAKPLLTWGAPPATTPSPVPAPTPVPPPLPTPGIMAPVPSGTESKSFIGEAWTGVKELVVGKPTPGQPPFARPGEPAPLPQPVRNGPAARTPSASVYASPPAYRWYGWGTTTPGANPHAPTGQYPNGSANWLSQTGATPGAFPAPAQTRRESPSWEPPAYARVPASSVEPLIAVTSPVSTWPVAPPATAAVPAMLPPPSLPPVTNPNGLNWQPAGGVPTSSKPQPMTNPVGTVVFRAQAPQASTVEELIKDAAKGWAIVEHVKTTGANKLAVMLVTSTEADARRAAEEISRVKELRPYEIQFEARVK